MDETYTLTLELIDGKVDEIKAMLMEILTWKSEVEAAMENMKGGGLLSMFSNMFQK